MQWEDLMKEEAMKADTRTYRDYSPSSLCLAAREWRALRVDLYADIDKPDDHLYELDIAFWAIGVVKLTSEVDTENGVQEVEDSEAGTWGVVADEGTLVSAERSCDSAYHELICYLSPDDTITPNHMLKAKAMIEAFQRSELALAALDVAGDTDGHGSAH